MTSSRRVSGTATVANRGAPGRTLGDHRQVQVRIDGHGQRARDRGRRHDELVRAVRPRRVPFSRRRMRWWTPKRCCSSMMTSPRSGELRRRPGSGHGCRPPAVPRRRRSPRAARPARAPCGARRARGARSPRARARRVRSRPVLLGQQLGRGHQGHLVVRLDRLERGEGRHHGLARAHIPLQQPLHGPGARQVGGDLRQAACSWSGVSAKGRTARRRRRRPPSPARTGAAMRRMRQTQPPQAHLMGHQFLEGQAPEGRVTTLQQVVQIRLQRRAMQIAQGRAQVREAQPGKDSPAAGTRPAGPASSERQGLLGQAPPGGLLQALGGRIDGGQARPRPRRVRLRRPKRYSGWMISRLFGP